MALHVLYGKKGNSLHSGAGFTHWNLSFFLSEGNNYI
jgi:hypothetical protein